MYAIFDTYLNRDTWHTTDPAEDEAFYRALGQVIGDAEFDPEAMGEYMRMAKGLSTNSQDLLAGVILKRVEDARAVQSFRRYNSAG